MGGSINVGATQPSILKGFSLVNHPFWGTPMYGTLHMLIGDHSHPGRWLKMP